MSEAGAEAKQAPTGGRVLRSTLAQWVAKCGSLMVALVTVALLTRSLGTEDFGRFALVATFLSVVVVGVDWGLPLVVTRDLSQDPTHYDVVMRAALIGRLWMTPVAYLLAMAAAVLLYGDDRVVVLGLAVGLLALVPGTVVSALGSVYQEQSRLGRLGTIELVTRIAGLGTVLAVLGLGGGVLPLLVAQVAVSVVHGLLVARCLPRGSFRDYATDFDPRVFRRMLRTSLPLGFALGLNVLYARLDVVMLSLLGRLQDVALYVTAYRVMEVALVFPSLFAAAALPALSRAAAQDRPRVADLVERGLRFVALVVMPLAAVLVVCGESLAVLVAGEAFRGAGAPLSVLGLATAASGLNILLGITIIALGVQARALWLNVSALLLNAGLNAWLIPEHGVVGAASATAVAETFVLVCAFVLVRSRLGAPLSLRGPAAALASALAAGGAAASLAGHGLLLQVLVLAVTYACVAVALGAVRRADLAPLLGSSAGGGQ